MNVARQGSRRSQPGRLELSPDVVHSILQVITAGWAVASKTPGATRVAHEEVLNELLREGMRWVVDRDRAMDSDGRLPKMQILGETGSRSRPDVERPDGRIDIPILLMQPFSHEPHALVECKRVAGNNAKLCRLYVVEGVDRFASGKYAGSHATAFMVGYVIAGTRPDAADGVNGYLGRQGRLADRMETLLSADTWTRRSRHARASGFPITLLHTFVAVR